MTGLVDKIAFNEKFKLSKVKGSRIKHFCAGA